MLSGKKAIVTGGARGIGLAIATELINQGATIVICSRTATQLKEASAKLNTIKKNVYEFVADVSDKNSCKELIEYSHKALGNIDILINNAGIYGPIGKLEENDLYLWSKTIQVNLLGAVYLSHLVIPIMKKNGRGKIISVAGSGVGGSKALPRFSAYFTSKTAIVGFTETLAEELKADNIQVNCVSPGGVNTYLTDFLISQGPQKTGKEMYGNAMEQKKSGGTPPELVAELVAFLSSEKANHITGRFLSAKWDKIEKLTKDVKLSANIYRLRRIDDFLFYEKKQRKT